MKPKRNQLETANTNSFPTYLKCQLIISSHLKLYRACKQTLIAQKSRLMRIIQYVSLTVLMHTATHSTNCQYYGSCLCIKTLQPIDLQRMSTKPTRQRNNNWSSRNECFVKKKSAQDYSCKERCNCNYTTTTKTKFASKQTCNSSP